MSTTRVIIAVRVSSEDQRQHGYGHATQLQRLPQLVAELGWELARRPDGSLAIYDEGAASTTMAEDDDFDLASRPVMAALIRELGETQPTFLVCRKIDRLHRSNLQWQYLQHKLRLAGVEGVAQFPGLSGSPEVRRIQNPRDRAFAAMEAAWASLEKEELKEKLMVHRRDRAERDGLPNGGPTPYGYARTGRKSPLVVVEAEARVYLRMVEWTLQGWGPARIAKALTDEGVPTRSSGRGWTATTVRRVLMSEAQTGRIRARFGGRDAPDNWLPAIGQPAIVDRATWQAMQDALAERSHGRGASNRRRHALAGLLRCSACGATLKARVNRPKRKDGGRYEYWHYTCKVYSSGCTEGYTISEPRALAELGELVDARLAATDSWGQAAVVGADLGAVEDRIGSLAEQVATAEEKLRRAHTAYIDAPDDLVEVARDELNKRRARARELRAELEDAQSTYAAAQRHQAPAPDLEKLRELLSDWRSFPDNEKRMALEAVIDHAVLGPPGRARRLTVVWTDGTTAVSPEAGEGGTAEGPDDAPAEGTADTSRSREGRVAPTR